MLILNDSFLAIILNDFLLLSFFIDWIDFINGLLISINGLHQYSVLLLSHSQVVAPLSNTVFIITLQLTFIVGCIAALGSFVWLFMVSKDAKASVYVAALLMGCGCSIMLVTSLAMTADLIGTNKVSTL